MALFGGRADRALHGGSYVAARMQADGASPAELREFIERSAHRTAEIIQAGHDGAIYATVNGVTVRSEPPS